MVLFEPVQATFTEFFFWCLINVLRSCAALQWPGGELRLRLYLLLAAVPVLLGVLRFSQQVRERQRLQGTGAGGSGIPERVAVPGVSPAAD